MKGYKGNIEKLTRENDNFRKVMYTGQNPQLVLMGLEAGENIGMETHMNKDQFFRFESGVGKCIIYDTEYNVVDGDAIFMPAGARHNVINTGTNAFKMYTNYGPPNYQDGTLHKNKKNAEVKVKHLMARPVSNN